MQINIVHTYMEHKTSPALVLSHSSSGDKNPTF